MGLLLLTVTDVSTTCAVVIFRFKVSCITTVDGIRQNIEGFKFKVRIKYQVEKYISTKNNKLETFYEKWPKDISPL